MREAAPEFEHCDIAFPRRVLDLSRVMHKPFEISLGVAMPVPIRRIERDVDMRDHSRISDIDCTRTGIDLNCRSHLELLNIQMPLRLWQSSCTHTFGDAMCQFDRSSMHATFSAGRGSSEAQIATSVSPTPPNLYVQGTIIGVKGANARSSRTVATMAGGWVYVRLAFLSPILAGDQFQLLPGCDRTLSTCTNIFNNVIHFGGFPYIPTPETAL